MSNPFFSTHWVNSRPTRHPYYYYSPSQVLQPEPIHHYTRPVQLNPVSEQSAFSPKVVKIPVQFINPEQPAENNVPARSKSESAIKIQKVFKGFLVRKSLKKIKQIKKEVEDIEKSVSRNEYVELLKENGRERIKVNEMLMGLLFKLDSIRGFGSGVRDCRKAVIRKAIALQERVDTIATVRSDQIVHDEKTVDKIHQSDLKKEVTGRIGSKNAIIEEPVQIDVEDADDEASKGGELGEMRANCEVDRDDLEESEVDDEKEGLFAEMDAGEGEGDEKEGEIEGMEMNISENGVEGDENIEIQSKGDVCNEKDEGMFGTNECVEDLDEKAESQCMKNVDETGDEMTETPREEEEEEEDGMLGGINECMKDVDDSEGKEGERGDEKERNAESLGKIMEDNAKMMNLMTQLFEKNELQSRMLSTLTQRVEQLEKAFVCDKMKRKKKRHGV